MKRIYMIVALLCASVAGFAQYLPGSYKDIEESEVVTSMKEHVRFLSSLSLEGRKAGSDGETEAARYVSEVLSSYGVDVLSGTDGEVFGMKQEKGDTLVSRNVIGFIPGYDRTLKDHYIVIGARLDNIGTMSYNDNGQVREKIFPGANGNASGLAMLLQLSKMLSTNSVLLKRSVIIAAFGASLEMNAGSWYFLNRTFKDAANIDAFINLDMLGTESNGFYAYTASNVDLNARLASLSETLQPVKPQVVSKEPVGSDHRSFYDKEIPAVMFTTGMYPEYNTEKDTESVIEYDGMERELEYIYSFTVDLVNGAKPQFREGLEKKKTIFDQDVYSYNDCDYKPTFLGSSDISQFLKKWVYVYLRYPASAVKEGVQGKVQVDFVIDEKGKVTDVKVTKGVDERLDDEAVRVIKASPDWKPGRVRGQKVKSAISLTVEFRLERKKNK